MWKFKAAAGQPEAIRKKSPIQSVLSMCPTNPGKMRAELGVQENAGLLSARDNIFYPFETSLTHHLVRSRGAESAVHTGLVCFVQPDKREGQGAAPNASDPGPCTAPQPSTRTRWGQQGQGSPGSLL